MKGLFDLFVAKEVRILIKIVGTNSLGLLTRNMIFVLAFVEPSSIVGECILMNTISKGIEKYIGTYELQGTKKVFNGTRCNSKILFLKNSIWK
jgi:hypothetical protein